MDYRTSNDGEDDSWHFNPSCSHWPEKPANVILLENLPKHLTVCRECLALAVAIRTTNHNQNVRLRQTLSSSRPAE
jgi:hypothetical protein